MHQSYSKEKEDPKTDTHGLSLGALFTFEASNAGLTLNERKKSAHTGFSPKNLPPSTSCPQKPTAMNRRAQGNKGGPVGRTWGPFQVLTV